MYFSKFLKIFTIKSQLAKLCHLGKATCIVLDNITTTLKKGKGEEAAFSLPFGKVSHLILSKIVELKRN